MRPRLARIRDRALEIRDRISPRPVVIATDDLRNGVVITTRYADYRSASGFTFATVAAFPDGTVAERHWSSYEVDARAAHQGCALRHARRTLPDR